MKDVMWWGRACKLKWKEWTLPSVEWPAAFQLPENERFKSISFLISTGFSGRICFPLGLMIPISTTDESSFIFLKQFSADAPFKMDAKHFSVAIPTGREGNHTLRKLKGELAERITQAIE